MLSYYRARKKKIPPGFNHAMTWIFVVLDALLVVGKIFEMEIHARSMEQPEIVTWCVLSSVLHYLKRCFERVEYNPDRKTVK